MIKIKELLRLELARLLDLQGEGLGANAAFESPKLAAHGDLAITHALQLSKVLKSNPRQIALALQEALLASPVVQAWVQDIEIAGPGFINLRLKPVAKQAVIDEVLRQGAGYGTRRANAADKRLDQSGEMRADLAPSLLVEFVSANPTGPLHVGHGRQATLGDALCRLFETQGYRVHREFYYNDAGGQIDNLALSVSCRLHGIEPDDPAWPAEGYRGQYIVDIARAYEAGESVQCDDRAVVSLKDHQDMAAIREFAVAYLRREQDLDLAAFGLKFDQFYLESSLYTSGRVERAVEQLKASGHTYEKDGALWLTSTAFGDDKDRVMRKSEGGYTYFVPDVAYHLSKWERGFHHVINIQGSDHHGTIARVRAGLQAVSDLQGLGIPKDYPSYVLHTMVRVMRAGEEVKISKRAGSYVTLRDLIDWTSKDAVRFFLLSRKPDTEYLFDVDLAVAKNNDNPVYYVQYAHARICSILIKEGRMALVQEATGAQGAESAQEPGADLSPLTSEAALGLMLLLAKYPEVLTSAAKDLAPHDVTFYLRELAASYHSYYDQERILVEDVVVKNARLALVAAVAQVLRNGLSILGVSAPQVM